MGKWSFKAPHKFRKLLFSKNIITIKICDFLHILRMKKVPPTALRHKLASLQYRPMEYRVREGIVNVKKFDRKILRLRWFFEITTLKILFKIFVRMSVIFDLFNTALFDITTNHLVVNKHELLFCLQFSYRNWQIKK